MQYLLNLFNTRYRMLAVVAVVFAPLSTWAEGTNSGDTVTNSVTMTYTVNTIVQTETTSVDFTVDRKLLLSVTTPNTDWVDALAGQTQAGGNATSIQFEITNRSNSSVDVVIGVIDQAVQQVDGFSAIPGGSTAITPAGITVWEDTDGDGELDGGETTLGTSVGEYSLTGTFAEDESRTISISIDVAGGATADLYHTYTLVAAVANAGVVIGNDDSGNISPDGTAANNGNDKDTVEIVFADEFTGSTLGDDEGYTFLNVTPGGTGVDDADFDGQAVNAAGFLTIAALEVGKNVVVLWDPVSGNRFDGAGAPVLTSNPKAIPGALLLYVIGVSAGAGLDTTAVTLDDDIPDASVDAGNTTGELPATINMPATVDVDINGTLETFTLAAGVAADGNYHVQDCAGSALDTTAFAAGDPEIDDADLGACDDGDTGYVAYVVTVDDSP